MNDNNPFGSSPRQNLDDVFADLTNQDAEPESEPQPEPENTHANEALEVLDASNGDDHSGSTLEGGDAEGSGQDGENGEAGGSGDGSQNLGDDF